MLYQVCLMTPACTQPSHRCGPSRPQPRAHKIAHLRHAVESGDYGVSAEQLAAKMVHAALVALLTAGRGREQTGDAALVNRRWAGAAGMAARPHARKPGSKDLSSSS